MNFVEELKWRGILHDIMPGTEELLKKETVTAYIGFDPTADSLHVGSLAQIMTLLRFQKAGHKPIALIGGATGMVGDPSGKSEERNLLDEEALNKNVAGIKKQLEKFLDFNSGKNAAELVNNYDWMKEFTFLSFIREVGKFLTVNYMMAKDSVKNRLENGMSFTEFSYQLLQAYDFYELYKKKNCKLQMGGSDQWGNITSGTELIRRKCGGEAYALTTQLIKKADGTKFGKSEKGNIWLDPIQTPPVEFYQFWFNASDVDVENYIKYFTLLEKDEIESLIHEHRKSPDDRILQKRLAKEVTTMVHGTELYEASKLKSVFFGDLTVEELNKMKSEGQFLDTLAKVGFPIYNWESHELDKGVHIMDILVERTKIFPSKSEARKMIEGGGVSLNLKKVTDFNLVVDRKLNLVNDYILIKKGKKNFYWINFI